MIGIQAMMATVSIALATSDPGYTKYYRLYNKREKGYSGYGSIALKSQNYQDPYYRSLGEAYKSLPSRRGKSYHPRPATPSPYSSYQNHPYYQESHLNYPIRDDKPNHYSHHTNYNSYRHPIGAPKPYPTAPHPIAHPDPHPITYPKPLPHPVPHPHPLQPAPPPHPIKPVEPIPHPPTIPQVPQPHPNPTVIPAPLPPIPTTPQPQPAPTTPAPTPSPEPVPLPTPSIPVDISIPAVPDVIRPPLVDIPDIDIPSTGVVRPLRPIETIGRPPVAPIVRPPTFLKAIPGFVDIQKVNVRHMGEPVNVTPGQLAFALQFPETSPPIDPSHNIVQTSPVPSMSIETLFPVDEGIFGERMPQNTPIETLFPVPTEATPADTARTRAPILIPSQERVRPIRPVQRVVEPQITQIRNSARPQQVPIPSVDTSKKSKPIIFPVQERVRPIRPVQEAVKPQPEPIRNSVRPQQVRITNAQQIPDIPLLAKAVPAVPEPNEPNPQPLFKDGNVASATATATALLVQAANAEFGNIPPAFPEETPVNNIPRPPSQQSTPAVSKVDFSRFPSVVLPDPVPAVPLTQP